MLIPHTNTLKFNEDGQYGVNPAWGLQAGEVIFRCRCGVLYQLSGEWEIDAQGNVTPSVWHDEDYCGFHEFIQLGGYSQI